MEAKRTIKLNQYRILLFFLFIPFFLFSLWKLSLDYGISYDESIHKNYGYFIYYYLSSFGKNPIALSYLNLPYYGGAYDFMSFLFSKIMQKIFNEVSLYEFRHFFNGIIASIAYFSVYFIGKTLHSKLLGFLSVLCLLLIPEYMGHSFMNPKDIPFASFYTLSILLMIFHINSNNKFLFYMLSLTIGLSIGVRILGVLLWVNFFVLQIIDLYKIDKDKRDYKNFLIKILALGFISYLVAISTWPFLLKYPLKGAYLSLKTMSDFPWAGDMKILGQIYKPAEIGRIYIYIMFLYTLPDFILLIVILSLLSVVYFLWKKDFTWINQKVLILIIGSLFPLILITVTGSTLYNGYRQVFFIIPSFVVFLLYLILRFFESIQSKFFIVLPTFLISVLMVDTGITMYQMHPYEYVYFNRIVSGGMEKGASLFDVDYWSIGFKEASEYLIQLNINSQSSITVGNTATPEQTDYYLNRDAFKLEEDHFFSSMKNLNSTSINDPINQKYLRDYHQRNYTVSRVKYSYTEDTKNSDYLIGDTIVRNQKELNGNPIYIVKRLSIPICIIYQKKSEPSHKN